MQLAASRLTAAGAAVSAVAGEVGYESEAAFCRAFKKVTGLTPGSWRGRHAGAEGPWGLGAWGASNRSTDRQEDHQIDTSAD
jgi:AraC-like DNA-binding protein